MAYHTIDDVKARWAYSELQSPRAASHYDGANVPDLIAAKASGKLFSHFDASEKARLAAAFDIGRFHLSPRLNGLTHFEDCELTLGDVCSLEVLGFEGNMLNWAVSHRCGPYDARLQSDATRILPRQGEKPIVIPSQTGMLLIDGYCRVMFFLRQASISSLLPILRGGR